ncbi:hypothetical protein D3C84_1010610 [compost metagenome]
MAVLTADNKHCDIEGFAQSSLILPNSGAALMYQTFMIRGEGTAPGIAYRLIFNKG